ncbi:MAG TPA: hypothetical protein PK629_02760 [Oscillospiraceae bacterium]|nr:hypothetical protein [Oscillospiraceae bacterium]HPF56767.1 hypothetical protein [Clostridiales bacterium]HPK34247.1 hypothetical protein [Oscillospiraceae bacterium]HPR74850.1 hypothetical protein [Oscillospiraceae bacterium]
MEKVDFSYAFAPPHRITLSLPSGSDKILTDISKNSIKFSFSYHSLLNSVYNAYQTPAIERAVEYTVLIDGKKVEFNSWRRAKDGTPAFHAAIDAEGVLVEFYGIAAGEGAVIRIRADSADGKAHALTVIGEAIKGSGFIHNPAWVDGKNANILICLQWDRSDRIISMFRGADRYSDPVRISKEAGVLFDSDKHPKPWNSSYAEFDLKVGKECAGYIFIPYQKYVYSDIDKIEQIDFASEIKKAEEDWKKYLISHCIPIIPDEGMKSVFDACLADLFVMREKIRKNEYSVTCGTEVYRSPNDTEPVIADEIFDRMGFSKEVREDMPVHMGGCGNDGDWNTPTGWNAKMWMTAGIKSYFAFEHFRLTGDKDFLKKIYPMMKANSDFQNRMRLSTENDQNPSCRGLMPRGMGDCGLMNNGDFYGVFYPHSLFSIVADRETKKAAEILGYSEDAKLLSKRIQKAKDDAIFSLRKEAVADENGGFHIPSGPEAKENTSRYGALYAYAVDMLDFKDPLIQGTLKWLENDISEGGLPKNLGWLKDGLWVAIALDNISSAYLSAGMGDEAVKYLYPTANHASPFVTWCEERGSEKGSDKRTGDSQHLWTPVAVCRYLLDALCLTTESGIKLVSGIPRDWLSAGNTVGIKKLRVPGGTVTYKISRAASDLLKLDFESKEFDRIGAITADIRIPEKALKIKEAKAVGGKIEFSDYAIKLFPDKPKMKVKITLGPA